MQPKRATASKMILKHFNMSTYSYMWLILFRALSNFLVSLEEVLPSQEFLLGRRVAVFIGVTSIGGHWLGDESPWVLPGDNRI